LGFGGFFQKAPYIFFTAFGITAVIGKNVVIGKIDSEAVLTYSERGYFFKAKREFIQKNSRASSSFLST